MKDLIVSATRKEITPFLESIGINDRIQEGTLFETLKFDIIITGVGILATAYSLGSILALKKYNLIINFGIAGSFSEKYPLLSLVNIKEETLADLGAEDSENNFKDLFEMGLLKKDAYPFINGTLRPIPVKSGSSADHLPEVRSITVNRVLAHEKSIKWIRGKYNPDTVSMEGGAVFYASLQAGTPCIQIRSVSDIAGTEDRKLWDINGAILSLNKKINEIYEQRYSVS